MWIIDPERAHLLPEVGALLMAPLTNFRVPGGRWLKVHQLCGIHLNSPRLATEILRELQKADAKAEAERYKPKPAGNRMKVWTP